MLGSCPLYVSEHNDNQYQDTVTISPNNMTTCHRKQSPIFSTKNAMLDFRHAFP